MATDAHSHDAHDAHDDHGHGHGHAEFAWEIIPENSRADSFLIALAFATLLGLFAFAGFMVTAPEHHSEHGDSATHENPSGSHGE